MLLNLFGGGERILDRVVEDRGHDRLVVELEVGEDARDLDRMTEIWVAGGADLGAVRLHREDVGAVDQPFVRIGIVGPDFLDKLILSKHAANVGAGGAFVQARKKKGPRRGSARGPGGTYWAASALSACGLASELQLTSWAALSARPSTMKLSTVPARLARDWQRTSGRLSCVLPWQAAGPQFQVMSRVTKRSLVGAASLAE